MRPAGIGGTARARAAVGVACAALVAGGADATEAFERPADLVRVFGHEVPALTGAPAERYAVLAIRDGALAPVPFQLDERNPFGFLVLDQGPFAEQDIDGGVYDANDEVLFFASDAGERADAASLEAVPGLESHAEIRLEDPVSGAAAYAYLVRSTALAPRSDRDDVAYDPERDLVATTVYSMGFATDDEGRHRSYPDVFSVTPAAGGDGRDVLDRLKLRIGSEVLFGLLSFDRNEDDLRTELLAWRDGPVRVVRRVETALHVIFGIYAPPISVDAIYYRDFVETPNVLDMPLDLGSVLSKLTMRVSLDLGRDGLGMRVVSPDNPDVPPLDGVLSEGERALVTEGQPWYLVHGEQGTFLVKLIFGDSLPFDQVLDYADDADGDDPPEAEPGRHEVGRDLRGGLAIQKGRHAYNAFLFVPSHWRPGAEQPYLAMIDHPLAVSLSGPGTVPPERVEAGEVGGSDWRATFDEMRAAITALDDYEAELLVYSSIYRGRKLEGRRVYEGSFHRDPRWVHVEVPRIDANYDDPLGEGTEFAYYADEKRVVGRGSGVRRVFGTVEMPPEAAPMWWWGESVTTLDLWSLAERWADFVEPGHGRLGQVTIAGRTMPQLTLTSTSKTEMDLRNPLGTGAAQVEIKQIRITLDPETKLPVRVESYIPGNPAPVSSIELREIDTDVELERDDFDLDTF